MIPTFAPIIGSGFEGDAALSKNYLDTNLRTIQDNFGRAAAAQQTQNNYLKDLAQMRQAQVDREAAAQQRTQDTQLGVSEREAQAAETRRVGDRNFQFTADQANRKQREKIDSVDNFARATADEIASSGKESEDALKAANQAQRDLDAQAAKWSAKMPMSKVAYSRQAGIFVPQKGIQLLPDEQASVNAANESLAEHTSARSEATTAYQDAQKTFAELVAESERRGLAVRKHGNEHALFYPDTGKWYKSSGKVTSKPPPQVQAETSTIPSWFGGNPTVATNPSDNSELFTGQAPETSGSGNWLARFMNPWAGGGAEVTPAIPQAQTATIKRYNAVTGMVE